MLEAGMKEKEGMKSRRNAALPRTGISFSDWFSQFEAREFGISHRRIALRPSRGERRKKQKFDNETETREKERSDISVRFTYKCPSITSQQRREKRREGKRRREERGVRRSGAFCLICAGKGKVSETERSRTGKKVLV